ncbi:MAG: PAS-domain containing protein, partial [Rhodospirillales bacterium]
MAKRASAEPTKKRSSKARLLDVLIIEDVEDDALLLVRHLEKSGLRIRHQRVETADSLHAALEKQAWDVVLCDHGLTGFNSLAALGIVKERGLDLPFIIVSGTIGEEKAAEVMRAGVHDLILKANLSRLAPAIERELREAEARRAKRRADEELDMERRLLQNLMASLPLSIYFKDLQHRYLRLNEAEVRVLNAKSVESVIGKLADDFVPPERARMRQEEEERIFATGKPLLDRIEEVQWKDGRVRWLAATKAPIRDRDGEIIGLVGITRDITRRKGAEDALKESEAFFRAIVDYAPAAVVIKDLKGRNLVANKVFCSWYGTTPEWIVGKTHDDFLDKEGAERVRAQERLVLETKTLVEQERRVTYPDGVVRDVLVQKFPILDSGGDILALGTILIDISERKRAEEAVRASVMRLSGAIDSMQEGFALFDAADRLVAFNAEYERLNPSAPEALEKGLTFEYVIRANVERGMIGDAVGREEEFIRERMRLHRNPEGPIIRQRADGKIFMLQESRTPEGGIALSFIDITELKRMEEGLRDKTRQLEVVLESMDQGIYAVDSNLTCTLINRRHVKSHGLPPELSRPGVRFEDLARFNARKGRYGPGDVEEHVRRRVEIARQNQPIRYEFDLRNGRIVELRSNPLPGGGFVRTSTDITELKQKEDALRESEERFRAVLNNSPSAVTLKDKDGRYQLVNRTFGSWSNCRPEDIIGKTSFDLFPEQEAKKFREADQAVLGSGETAVLEGKITCRDGTILDYRHFSWSSPSILSIGPAMQTGATLV